MIGTSRCAAIVAPFVPTSVKRQVIRRNVVIRSQNGADQGSDSPAMSEDLIARLKTAEEEAQRLRAELAAAKAQSSASESDEPSARPTPAAKRIDGGDLRRETLFSVESKSRNWLSESDVDFFTGAGPSETENISGNTSEESAEVQRRILIGLGLTAAVGAFGLIPTDKLAPAPSKPLFFYLVPVIRTQALLEEIERIIPDGDYDQLKRLLRLIEGSPNNIQENLRSAAVSLPDSAKAETIARDVYEYLKGIDYQVYYDAMPGGKQQDKLFDYSLQSTHAAQLKIKEFLKLMPRDQIEAAEQQAAVF